jgi:hypothetical protein
MQDGLSDISKGDRRLSLIGLLDCRYQSQAGNFNFVLTRSGELQILPTGEDPVGRKAYY